MGGLEIIWPFTDHLFLFVGEKFNNLHKEIILLIRLYNESWELYPEFQDFQTKKIQVDSKIESYYRKFMNMENK